MNDTLKARRRRTSDAFAAAAAAHILDRTALALWAIPDMMATSFSPSGIHITTGSDVAAAAAVTALERQALNSEGWKIHAFPVAPNDNTRGNYRDGTVDGVRVFVGAIWHEGTKS